MEFDFDFQKSKTNKAKHGIDFIEIQLLWDDPNLIEIPAKITEEINKQRALFQEEQDAKIRKGAEETTKIWKDYAEAQKTGTEGIKELQDELSKKEPTEQTRKLQTELQILQFNLKAMAPTQIASSLDELTNKMRDLKEQTNLTASEWLNLAYSMDGAISMMEEGEVKLSSILTTLAGILMMIPGAQGWGAGIGIAGLFGKRFGFSNGGIIGMQKGGIVDKPLIAVGEREPEVIAPLSEFYKRVEGMFQKYSPYKQQLAVQLQIEGLVSIKQRAVQDIIYKNLVSAGIRDKKYAGY